jgi:L-rhamnose mutarotase
MSDKVIRLGKIVKVSEGKIGEYKYNHEHIPEDVVRIIKENNVRNYNIFFRDGYLFAYCEYIGSDLEGDFKKIDENPISLKWYEKNAPCQIPIESAEVGELWSPLELIWHMD